MVKVAALLLTIVLFLSCSYVYPQVHRFGDPLELPYNINGQASEIMPLLSYDGTYLFFSRSGLDSNKGGRYAGHDVWVSEQLASGWTRASNTFFNFNTKGNDAIIGVDNTGTLMYLMRTFPGKRVKGIYLTRKANGKWSEPELVPIEGVESQASVGFYVHPDGDLLLISMHAADSRGQEDLYICFKRQDNTWSKPKNLGTAINTPGIEISPFLSADKRRLYFSSSGHKGLGDSDIFVSQRLYDSWETWTVPVNLGEKVNSTGFDAYFSIFGDSVAYFSSARKEKFTNIYTASVSILFDNPDRKAVPLKEEEVIELFGASVERRIEFRDNAFELDARQKELLWFIAHRLISQKEVHILIIPSQDDPAEINGNRVNSIATQLANAGIEGSRINKLRYELPAVAPSKGEVRLVLVH